MHQTLLRPKKDWENSSIGAAGPPIKTEDGWLLLYQGSASHGNINTYAFGAALLDRNEPWKVIARGPNPILKPEETDEGVYPADGKGGIIFPTASIVDTNGQLKVFYGANDQSTKMASCSLNDLLAYLKQLDENGEHV